MGSLFDSYLLSWLAADISWRTSIYQHADFLQFTALDLKYYDSCDDRDGGIRNYQYVIIAAASAKIWTYEKSINYITVGTSAGNAYCFWFSAGA